ncbi:MAG TPA: TonB-dependent receptor [Bacteroidetes bacterium]|nr:TonB-dependent receptor [Bacteroidota bacterium]HIL58377.1 TonB-dependent receptor [Rhodothermales bacterium]
MVRLALALLLLSSAASAQTAVLAGRVTSAEGPVPGATVRVGDRGTATDLDGRFRLAALAAGVAEAEVSAVGFETAARSVALRAGETTTLDVRLETTALALGEVVVQSAGSLVGPRGVRDVPGSVTVLGPQALARHRDTDLHRALATVPGVSIQEEDGYGLRPNIGIRGTQTDRSSGVTLMEDGVLIAPAPYAAPAAYYVPPAGRVDGLEVRKGSAQIAYGPYTTGGAINLLSARIPARPAARVEVKGGTDEARTVHVRAGTDDVALGPVQLGIVAEGFADGVDGFKEIRAFDGSGATSDETGYAIRSGLLKLRARLAASPRAFHSLELKLTADDQTSDETYLGLTPQDFEAAPFARYAATAADRFASDHQMGHLRYVGVFGRAVDVSATLYVTRFRRDWFKLDAVSDGLADDVDTDGDGIADADRPVPISALLADPVLYADEIAVARAAVDRPDAGLFLTSNDRQFRAEGLDLGAGLRLSPAVDLRAGLRLHRDQADRLQREDRYALREAAPTLVQAGTPGGAGNRIDRAEALAGFAEATLTAGRLTLTPGLRVEHVRQSREDYGTADPDRAGTPTTRANTTTALIPGLGLRYDATEEVTLFGGVHRGFAPGTSQPGVEPERSVNAEAGLRASRGEALALQAVGFATWYQNLLGADFASSGGTGTGELFNGGAAEVVGAELALDADALALAAGPGGRVRVPVRLAYTVTDARFASSFQSDFLPWGSVFTGDAIPYVAPHVVSASAGVETGTLRVDLRANGTAATRAVAGQGAIPEGERIDARLLFDASAEWTLPVRPGGARLAALALVRNLTDEVYVASRRPAGLRPGLPRTVLVGLRADL